MYLITNRVLNKGRSIEALGSTPNPRGPNELLMVDVTEVDGEWRVNKIKDKLSPATVAELKIKYNLDIDTDETWHGSLKIACELFERARVERKSMLFFVHGYNNDVGDVLTTAHEIEEKHGVIVVPFTWPANGGGAISGTAAYLSDKSDARASAGALNRTIAKIQQFHLLLTQARNKKCQDAAYARHKDNPMAAAALFTELMKNECTLKISLLCHSMGNYLFKHTFATSENDSSKLVFDNVCLVAADTNSEDHADWISKIDVRKRTYIVINENDSALRASRIKPGKEQKARLGHYISDLNCPGARYIDLTAAEHIGSEHSYFKGSPVDNNNRLRNMFTEMFNGIAVENTLHYDLKTNSYRL
ncbi:MAG: esterase/lipase superfamily enzyme [Motiliproteus sp.]|jgi:esterase/lipase superfamily enzyme